MSRGWIGSPAQIRLSEAQGAALRQAREEIAALKAARAGRDPGGVTPGSEDFQRAALLRLIASERAELQALASRLQAGETTPAPTPTPVVQATETPPAPETPAALDEAAKVWLSEHPGQTYKSALIAVSNP